jgi:uncharacterized membrane protein
MRIFFLVAFFLNISLNVVSLWLLPEIVAIHFSLGGRPDGWASKETHVLLMLFVDGIAFLPLCFGAAVIDQVPARFISLPYKQYWLRGENRAQAKRMLSDMMDGFGLSLFGFLFGVSLLAIDANRSVPVRLNEPLFLVLLAVFLLYTLIWTIRLILRFRPPDRF